MPRSFSLTEALLFETYGRMTLSLSVRIAESFHSKEKASIDLNTLAGFAANAGYSALCMRASQVGVQSDPGTVERAVAILQSHRLGVTMVSGNFDIVYNNDAGPNCLRQIRPFVQLAQSLKAPLIRVALKNESDIPWAQQAADEADLAGLKLVHQCHTQSLFETVDGIERTLQRINRPNFGLVYEPANLELCGQDYGLQTVQRLAPWIFNVYLQNQSVHPDGRVTLDTWCRGPVSFDLVPIHQSGGIDFSRVFEALASIGYRGPITVHQAQTEGEPVEAAAVRTASFLLQLARQSGLGQRN